MIETWKPVVGYEGLYEVSSLGQVRSLDKIVGRNTGSIILKGVMLRHYVREKGGYHNVSLYRNRVKKTHDVHVLVATAFYGPCPLNMECCHGDGDPSNNAAKNLRWDTRESNTLDRSIHGTNKSGEENHFTKLSDADVVAIRALAASDVALSAIAARYDVSYQRIWQIVRQGDRS